MTEAVQVREAASQLSEQERAELAVYLIGSLENTHYWVSDDEVEQRREELESGEIKGLTIEEFKKACGR